MTGPIREIMVEAVYEHAARDGRVQRDVVRFQLPHDHPAVAAIWGDGVENMSIGLAVPDAGRVEGTSGNVSGWDWPAKAEMRAIVDRALARLPHPESS